MLKIFGYLYIGFGIIDFATSHSGHDLTGVQWSPIAPGMLGSVLISMGGDNENDEAEEEN